MADTASADPRYWCHECSRVVDPEMDPEIKCPNCNGGFVEEMAGDDFETSTGQRSDRTLSLWAPILLGMLDGSSRQPRPRRDDEDADLDREFEDFVRRRRRRSVVRRLLESIRDDMADDPTELSARERRERDRERESAILINAFNQAIILQGGSSSFDDGGDENNHGDHNNNSNAGAASLEDYFLGQGLDQLLQHLAENDPSRYGTPPAKKEFFEAMPTVKIADGATCCAVCLDDFELGSEAKEMPCNHKFHADCILQWLTLHGSCPICRFQLPVDETKDASEPITGNNNRAEPESSQEVGGDVARSSERESSNNNNNNNRSWGDLVPWPFTGLFSTAEPPNAGGSSSSSSNPPPSSFASRSNANTEEN